MGGNLFGIDTNETGMIRELCPEVSTRCLLTNNALPSCEVRGRLSDMFREARDLNVRGALRHLFKGNKKAKEFANQVEDNETDSDHQELNLDQDSDDLDTT